MTLPDGLIVSLGRQPHDGSGVQTTFTFDSPFEIPIGGPQPYWLVGTSTGSASFTIADSTAAGGSGQMVGFHAQSFDAGQSWNTFAGSARFRVVPEPTANALGIAALLAIASVSSRRGLRGRAACGTHCAGQCVLATSRCIELSNTKPPELSLLRREWE